MKKSLITLVVLGGISSAVSAQTSVAIYGVVDLGIVQESGGAAGSVTKLTSGIANGSRLGFKGVEDLGGGLSANFTLENGFDASTGAMGQGGLLFGRQAFVGLSGSLGSVKLGRQYTPVDDLVGAVDPFYNGFAGRMQNVFQAGYVSRANNDVMIATPVIGGFSANLAYGFGEVAGDTAAGRYLGASAGYAEGPLLVRLAWQSSNNAAATGSARNTMLGATYNFGSAKLHAAYARSKTDAAGTVSVDANDGMLGVSVPFGASTLLASYVRRNDRLAVNKDADQIGIGYTYDMSKRTSFYAAYARISNKNGAAYVVGNATEAGSGDKAFNLGIRHRF